MVISIQTGTLHSCQILTQRELEELSQYLKCLILIGNDYQLHTSFVAAHRRKCLTQAMVERFRDVAAKTIRSKHYPLICPLSCPPLFRCSR